MSQAISDILSAQNLTRAGAVAGIAGTAQSTFNSGLNSRNRVAVGGALLTQLGGVLNSFNSGRNPRSPEGFDLKTFISTTAKLSGFINPSHFMVYVTPPKWLRSATSETKEFNNFGKILPFLCSGSAVPGMRITTAPVPHYGYGVAQPRPLRPTFENIQMQYYMDNQSVALDFFTKWIQKIINFDVDATGARSTSGAFYGEVSYMDEYQTTIDIYVFDSASARVLHVKLHEAFPVSIGDVRLDWGSSDQLALLDVAIAYKSWTSNYLTPATIDRNSLRNLSLGSALIRIGTAATTLSSLLRQPTGIADIFNTVRNASSVVRYISG
jgi:hypothetical protein